MKSSEPVFTRQNPFTPASAVRRAHYHPSRKQSLSKKEKKTSLSPARSSRVSSQQQCSLPRESRQLHENQDDGYSATDERRVFTEIWPSTDSGSSPDSNTGSPETMARKLSARPETSTVSPGVQDDSVLAKYIERFRLGRPRSREERGLMASASGEEQMPFWWMSPSPIPSSSLTKPPEKDGCDSISYSPAGQHRRDRTLSGEFDDTELLHLQERACSLLLRGECVQSDGSIPVSSDGLGCSDFSSPVSVDEPVRRPLIPTSTKPVSANVTLESVRSAAAQKSVIPSLAPPARPEEDILFQWRLRRKMEQAREWSQSVQRSGSQDSAFSWQDSSLNPPSTRGQSHKVPQRDAHPHITAPQPEVTDTHRPPFPAVIASGSSASQPQGLAHVPAHMHLLCDVLPCPVKSSHAKDREIPSQRSDGLHTESVHKKTQVPENSSDTLSGGNTSSSPRDPSEAGDRGVRGHQEVPEKFRRKKWKSKESEKRTAVSIREQRKSARASSHHSRPKRLTPLKGQRGEEGSLDREPPPSPVHTALGQVVSDVLFPSEDSSPAQEVPVSSASLPHAVSHPSPSALPLHNPHNSLEVISQLLQEAEDSDEREFEDDPLLRVLRQQRKWVKDQISEVNVLLGDFLEEQQDT